VLIGLLLIPPSAYWLAVVEMVRGYHYSTTLSLFFNVVFVLLVIVLLNAALRRWAPRLALAPGELATVYILVSLGSATAGVDWAGLTAVMTYPMYHASPENQWGELFVQDLPSHLMVRDPTAVRGFWTGHDTLYLPENYLPWIRPLLWWLVFVVLMAVLFLCITSLLRRRWLEIERLSYPIVQLPMVLSASPERLTRSRGFWAALGLVLFIDLINGLQVFWPVVPDIAVRSTASETFLIGSQIIDPPWNAVGFLSLAFYPFVIGIGMLIPAHLSFSCWFFYLLFKAQYVVCRHFGILQNDFPHARQQSLGAYLGLGAYSLWLGRRYLARVFCQAVGRADMDTEREAMSYRAILILGALSFAGIVVFAWHAGMAPWMAITWFAMYGLLSLSMTRIRAEMGIPSHEMHYIGPGQIMPQLFGTRLCGRQSMISTYAFYWFNYGQRCHPAPHLAEGHRLAERTHVGARSLSLPMVLAMVLGWICCTWATLHLFYQTGAGQGWTGHQAVWIPAHPAHELASNLLEPKAPRGTVITAVLTGAAVAMIALAGYTKLGWWPIHPIGYAVSSAWAMEHMWFALFVAWAIKSIVTRYGGTPAQRSATSVAMGLILGDFLMGSVWSLYGLWKKVNPYSIFP
jgi:hypothetical protein